MFINYKNVAALIINGKIKMAYVSKNPYNNKVMAEFDTLTDVEFEAKIAKAEEAFKTWKETSFATRTQIKKKAR